MRSMLLVTWFELRESLRSRQAVAMLIIYLLGSMGATGLFVYLLSEVENTLAKNLSVAQTDRPGAMTEALMESDTMLEIASGLTGDPTLAEQLVSIPPTALFYGWLSLTFRADLRLPLISLMLMWSEGVVACECANCQGKLQDKPLMRRDSSATPRFFSWSRRAASMPPSLH